MTTILLLILLAIAVVAFKGARHQKDIAITRRSILSDQIASKTTTPEYEARARAHIASEFRSYYILATVYYIAVITIGTALIIN